jgi:hypothetical protein
MAKDELPPVEDFSFEGIMKSIQNGVAEDLDGIAKICTQSRHRRRNPHGAHMPSHGKRDTLSSNAGDNAQGSGLTLQAAGSGDKQSKPKTSGQQSKPVAYGTLESNMSSSKSPEEGKAAKK